MTKNELVPSGQSQTSIKIQMRKSFSLGLEHLGALAMQLLSCIDIRKNDLDLS